MTTSYSTSRKSLGLIKADVDPYRPNDPAYVSSGYDTLVARLVEAAIHATRRYRRFLDGSASTSKNLRHPEQDNDCDIDDGSVSQIHPFRQLLLQCHSGGNSVPTSVEEYRRLDQLFNSLIDVHEKMELHAGLVWT